MKKILTVDTERDGFEAAMSDVAEILASGVRPLGPSELTHARARRRLLGVVSRARASHRHDQPAA
jgi:hypothetical protein